jgi:phage tail-like protein
MATITSVLALDLRTVRVTISEASGDNVFDAENWLFSGTSDPPFAVPTVTVVDGIDSTTNPTTMDLGLSYELTPGASYEVTCFWISATAAFSVPTLPSVAGRAFSFLSWIPEKNLREDDTHALRDLLSVCDDQLLVLLDRVDHWDDIQDPDLAPEPFLDQIISDLGNPVVDAVFSLEKKRILAKTLVPLYKRIGTTQGLIDAVRFFLGLESSVQIVNRQGMRLGQSLLTVDWILGFGPDRWRVFLKVSTPDGRAFTDYEQRVINQIVKFMRYAHETIVVQATLAPPTNLVAAASGAPGISLTWTGVTGATSYAVYESVAQGVGPFNGKRHVAPGTSLSIPMREGEARYFVVVGVNAQGEGLISNEASAVSE